MSVTEHISKAEARTVLSVVIVFVTLALLIMIFTIELPDNNKDMAYLVVGGFIGSFTTIVAFWFGSSKGSADKTELLKQTNPG